MLVGSCALGEPKPFALCARTLPTPATRFASGVTENAAEAPSSVPKLRRVASRAHLRPRPEVGSCVAASALQNECESQLQERAGTANLQHSIDGGDARAGQVFAYDPEAETLTFARG